MEKRKTKDNKPKSNKSVLKIYITRGKFLKNKNPCFSMQEQIIGKASQ